MSGILGLVNLDGAPVEAASLEAMRDAMAFWGPDGIRIWRTGAAGLGQLTLFNTPEAVGESLPRWLPDEGLGFTAEARIDNREELFAALDVPPSGRATMPDGDLLLRAYLRWGEAAPDRVLGDWSFAAWHPAERRLFLARDHHGNTALYYAADDRRVAFGSSIKALLALPGLPHRLNELRLAQVLTSWTGDGTESFYEGIHVLPPAHALTASPAGTSKRLYWSLEDAPKLRLKSDADYVEGLRSVLDEAVRCRLRSHRPVGATLSGGLDSGSVSVLAARALAARGKRLSGFCSAPLHDVTDTIGPYRFGDETPLARATAAHAGNIDLHLLRSEAVSPVSAIRQVLAFQDAPGHSACNFYWMVDMLQSARAEGLGTLLTGQGGNASISWHGTPWVAPGMAPEQAHDLRRRLKYQVLLPLVPEVVLLWRARRQARGRRWENTAIRPEFARRLRLAERRLAEEEADRELSHQTLRDPERMRYSIIEPGRSSVGAIWTEWGAAFGLEVRDPTLDRRVLEFSLGVPNRLYTAPDGTDRYLLRRAMKGLLPPEVLQNPRRGRQAADIVARLTSHASEMDAALAELEGSRAAGEYVNVAELKRAWGAVLAGPPDAKAYNRAVTVVTRGLMAGLFAARFS